MPPIPAEKSNELFRFGSEKEQKVSDWLTRDLGY